MQHHTRTITRKTSRHSTYTAATAERNRHGARSLDPYDMSGPRKASTAYHVTGSRKTSVSFGTVSVQPGFNPTGSPWRPGFVYRIYPVSLDSPPGPDPEPGIEPMILAKADIIRREKRFAAQVEEKLVQSRLRPMHSGNKQLSSYNEYEKEKEQVRFGLVTPGHEHRDKERPGNEDAGKSDGVTDHFAEKRESDQGVIHASNFSSEKTQNAEREADLLDVEDY
jgi:hypothetical protein